MKKLIFGLFLVLSVSNAANATEWKLSEDPSIAGALAILGQEPYSVIVDSEMTFRISGYADVDCNNHGWVIVYTPAGINADGQQVLEVDIEMTYQTVMGCPEGSDQTVKITPKWQKIREGETVELVIPGRLMIEFK